ncbi:hypothetical protein MGYG_02010 [Nannizzia gypsea CBS 118893]|uniref:Uncharacterized protein n=1 Tax=Arthroderma gypseum (strain ATCC MYA-4604 / CBS 118893) TaxID=535722 RepID=E4UP57_ARTGP|nr:hypothetical protein MGYG_02010 [Nannizzia gypsea CBS 118893]EFQ98999.1 hypothetical protein MGYG_02010 [Nannizzia gypsea CBS 118893]
MTALDSTGPAEVSRQGKNNDAFLGRSRDCEVEQCKSRVRTGVLNGRSTQQDWARGFRSTKERPFSSVSYFTYAKTRLEAESCEYRSAGVGQIWGVDGRITESWGSQWCLKSESRAAAYNGLRMDTSKRRR